ncbi:MAG: 50S ribosomal protein L25, partial [Bacteroidota bacterium]
ADLPDFIEVNIDNLEIGKAIKVGELSMDKITFLDTPNNPVVSVKTTRAAVEDAKAADADAKKK